MNYSVSASTCFGILVIMMMVTACGTASDEQETTGVNSGTAPVINASATARIDATLQRFVDAGDIAGISALIYEDGDEVYFSAYGMADLRRDIPMDRQTIVQIYSMTKPITGTALMQLYEKGAFDLDDPVSMHLPEFAGIQVYAGEDASGEPILEDPRREMTIRDLTRHTAGFAPNSHETETGRMLMDANPMNLEHTLTDMGERLASVPLEYHPGERWLYGISVDVQALLVERLSGIPFAEYLNEHILTPLGMNETRYFLPEGDRDRFSGMYNRDSDDGTLTQQPDDMALYLNGRQWPMTPGGYGLVSTLDDYMRFARMLQNEGELDGVRVLDAQTVQLMATNHLSDSVTERSWLPTKGQVGFGINFAVRVEPPESEDENFGHVGEFFWDGAASTLFWVDPKNQLTAVLFVQLMPYDEIGLHKAFRDAVYGT
ncbi:serine hydrolase [Balneolales bacterium ANBcel1]|nr:serine hydrolase [Balneolales bacterium ANBcel1]